MKRPKSRKTVFTPALWSLWWSERRCTRQTLRLRAGIAELRQALQPRQEVLR